MGTYDEFSYPNMRLGIITPIVILLPRSHNAWEIDASVDDAALHQLGRQHDASQARHAVAWARNAGFQNLGLDLIFGRPNLNTKGLDQEIDLFLALEPGATAPDVAGAGPQLGVEDHRRVVEVVRNNFV